MPPAQIIYHSISEHGVIEIAQERNHRSLLFGNNVKQSEMDISQPDKLVLAYTQAMAAGLLFHPAPKSVLLIGLGGGSLARFLFHHLPDCNIDVVEYREEVMKLAYAYFCLPNDSRLNITINDGYLFLLSRDRDKEPYDLIMIDAFNHDGIPESIKSFEFFEACRAALDEDGIVVMNLWKSHKDHYSTTMANLESVFRHNLLNMPVRDKGNIITFAAGSYRGFPPFGSLKQVAETLQQKIDLPFGTYLRELRRHNRWRVLSNLF